MSDTPRTDLAEWQTNLANERVVHADFARKLERKLAAANAQLVAKTDELVAMSKMYAAVTIIMEEMQREEAASWRPIETAPRGSGLDGPQRRNEVGYVDPPALLLAYRDGVEVGSYDWYYHPGYGNGGSLGQSPWRDHSEGQEIPEVTHWMPLPQPPREKEGGGA